MHYRNPNRNVANADAVVDRSPRLSIAIPRIDLCRAHFELKGSGNAVQHLAAIGFVGLLVRVQIDEAWCDHQAGRVNLLPAGQRTVGNRRNLSSADTDAAHTIEPRFRIDDAPANDDEIKVLRRQGDNDAKDNRE